MWNAVYIILSRHCKHLLVVVYKLLCASLSESNSKEVLRERNRTEVLRERDRKEAFWERNRAEVLRERDNKEAFRERHDKEIRCPRASRSFIYRERYIHTHIIHIYIYIYIYSGLTDRIADCQLKAEGLQLWLLFVLAQSPNNKTKCQRFLSRRRELVTMVAVCSISKLYLVPPSTSDRIWYDRICYDTACYDMICYATWYHIVVYHTLSGNIIHHNMSQHRITP